MSALKIYYEKLQHIGKVHSTVLLFVLSIQAVRHAQIMRQCGLEQVCCSNPVPTSDSGQSSPRLWVSNPYYLSPTRRSNMHANVKGRMNGYIGNNNREQNERRTDTGGTNFTYRDSQLPRLWHKGPSSSVPEHPKRPLPRSVRIRYCAWAWTFAIFPSESSQAFETAVLNQWPQAWEIPKYFALNHYPTLDSTV